MKKVQKDDYKKYLLQAGMNTANRVYPLSITEGLQVGDIFVNEGTTVDSVLFWHFCGFGYISGNPSQELLSDVYAKMLLEQKDRRLVLITDDEHTIHFFEDKDIQMDVRVEYSYDPSTSRVDE